MSKRQLTTEKAINSAAAILREHGLVFVMVVEDGPVLKIRCNGKVGIVRMLARRLWEMRDEWAKIDG